MGSLRVDTTEQLTKTTIITVGEFNTLLPSMDRPFRLKINTATEVLDDTIEQLDLLDTYRALHPKRIYFFPNMHGTPKAGHTAHHKISLNKFKSIKMISSIFTTTRPATKEKIGKEQTRGD